MRVKISVKNSSIDKNINIQNIIFRYLTEEGPPIIYFTCHRKYEAVLPFSHQTIIFHDKHGNEFFRSSKIQTAYRYYETDINRADKVQFAVMNLEYKNLGPVSKYFVAQRLKTSCNAKIITKLPIPPPPKEEEEQVPKTNFGGIIKRRIYRYKEPFLAHRYRRSIVYRTHLRKRRYLTKNIILYLITREIESVAPK